MCGIAGAARLAPGSPALDREALRGLRDTLAARGPDGAGEWWSPSGRAGLLHRRLAIIDPSPQAAQPMASADGRCVLAFNGEIYNHAELRRELEREGARFRTHSDAEVALELLARAPAPAAALGRLRGMYALALWDEGRGRLLLARDPYGIKPLYYEARGGAVRFASQARALERAGDRGLDPAGIVGFLLWGSVPEPCTLRPEVRSVPAGHAMVIGPERVADPVAIPLPEAAVPGGDARAAARAALTDSVRAHLVSDVPVGVFLSAGLDSGLVAALARRVAGAPLRAITAAFAAFEGTRDDEAPLAGETARALGLEPMVRRFSDRELEELWPRCLASMDLPSIDGFNTWLVALAAREAGLKVVLSGVGGDELFGSYPSFRQVPRLRAWARAMPLGARFVAALGRGTGRPKLAGLRAHGQGLAGAYFLRRGLYLPEELPAILGGELAAAGLAAYDAIADAGRFEAADDWRAVHDMESGLYLRNQLLRDADWAAMAHSVELRTPLVDATLRAALAAQDFEPARSEGKRALVAALAPELPPGVLARRKRGFAIPAPGRAPGRPGLRARALALELLERRGIAVRRARVPA
jgi:asparagine synthase (glutamine-hydrolysing)